MSDTTLVSIGQASTHIIATGTIGPPGPSGDNGAIGHRGIGGPIFTMEGLLETKVGTLKYRNYGEATIEGVLAVSGTAPTGSSIMVDVFKNGDTLFFSGKPTIEEDETNSGPISVPASPGLDDGDEITVDIIQVGSTYPGKDLTVEIFLS